MADFKQRTEITGVITSLEAQLATAQTNLGTIQTLITQAEQLGVNT